MDKPYRYITRSSAPTEHDVMPYGTVCEIVKDGATQQLFIQFSLDEEKPNWLAFRFE